MSMGDPRNAPYLSGLTPLSFTEGTVTHSVGHPHMLNLTKDSIGLFLLVNGQHVIGQVDSISEEYCTLIQPYIMMIMPQAGGRVQLGMIPYGVDAFLPEKKARAFAVSHIVQADLCPVDIEKQYRGARSGIKL